MPAAGLAATPLVQPDKATLAESCDDADLAGHRLSPMPSNLLQFTPPPWYSNDPALCGQLPSRGFGAGRDKLFLGDRSIRSARRTCQSDVLCRVSLPPS